MSDVPMPFDSPEAARKYAEEQNKKFQLHYRDHVHQINELLDSLTEDQLRVLDTIIVNVNNSDITTGYFRGQIDMVLEAKFKVCRCGINHEKELEHEFAEQSVDSEALKEDEPSDDSLMRKYNVEKVPEEVLSDYPTLYRCSNCLTPITTLGDRMLREPGVGGCSGCMQFNKTGTKWYGR